MAYDNFSKDADGYTCSICGSVAHKIDENHVKCSFCGQVTEIAEPKRAEFRQSTTRETTKPKKKKSNPVVKIVTVIIIVSFLSQVAQMILPVVSGSFGIDNSNQGIMKDFYEEVFGKQFNQITEEEFASIKYISYDYESNAKGGNSYHVLEYSFSDYEQCSSEEEFRKTIETWKINSQNKAWPSDFTKLTGLTRFDNYNSSWLSQFKFSSDCKLTCIITSDSLNTVSGAFNPETIKVLCTGSSANDYENLSKFPNLEILYMQSGEDNIDLQAIVNCPKLKSLILEGKLDASSYPYLRELKELQILKVRDLSLKYCDFLKEECPNLEELYVGDTEDGAISLLANAPNLKKLYFEDNEEGDASFVSQLTGLEELEFRMTKVEDLLELTKLVNLKSLKLDDDVFGMENQDLSALGNFQNLTDLSVSFGMCGKIYGLESVLNKSGISSLAFKAQFLDTDIMLDVGKLVPNDDLITLDIKGWELKDANTKENIGFDFLQNYLELKYLSLVQSNVKTLDFITPLFDLKTLDVQDNAISDYSPLESCRKLTELYVYGNPSINPKLSSDRVTVYKNRTYWN